MLERCAIYTRQSRQPRGDYSSCDAQFKMCFAYINAMHEKGWTLVEDRYDDIGESSETLYRHAMQRLIVDVEDGLIDRVVVTRLDRISRRLQRTCEFFQTLRQAGTSITIASQPELGGDSQGRLLINLMAVFAEFERDMTNARLEEARLALKSHGRRVAGRVPYGYEADPITKQLVISQPEGDRVRHFFRQAAEGILPSQIALMANQQNWSSNKAGEELKFAWTPRRILSLLNNRQFIGDIPYGNEWVPGQHEPLVSLEQFSAAQMQIEKRRNPMGMTPIPSQKHKHFLKELVPCPSCGRTMSISTKINRRKGGVAHLRADYCCRSTAGGQPPCPRIRIDAWALETAVENALDGLGRSDKPSSVRTEGQINLRAFADKWAVLNDAKKRKLIPLIVRAVTLNETLDDLTVTLRADALDYFE